MAKLTCEAMYALVWSHRAEAGVDQAMVTGAKAESDWDPNAVGDNGASIGLWQMHENGLGAGMTAAERADPDTACAAMLAPYRAAYAEAYDEGHRGSDLIVRTCCLAERPLDYESMTSVAADGYRAAIVPAWPPTSRPPAVEPTVTTLHYNPDLPPNMQDLNWNCSCCSVAWALQSLGYGVSEASITAAMVDAGLVNSTYGLLDGSGAQLQAWIKDTYGLEVHRWCPMDWDALTPVCGGGPGMLGGAAWSHWTAVRRGDAEGLQLSNSAPSWQGVGQHMSKAEWDRWGRWAYLYIPADQAPPEEGPVTDESRLYVMQTAQDQILANIAKALAVPDLPPEVVEPLLYGAQPAAETLARGEF